MGLGFIKPSLPTQPRQGSRYLGVHEHEGKKGDLTRITKCGKRKHRPLPRTKSNMVSWAKPKR
jgi:hypothetical protein